MSDLGAVFLAPVDADPIDARGRNVRFRATVIEDWLQSLESGTISSTSKRPAPPLTAGGMAPTVTS